jgi:hypothetical protein
MTAARLSAKMAHPATIPKRTINPHHALTGNPSCHLRLREGTNRRIWDAL